MEEAQAKELRRQIAKSRALENDLRCVVQLRLDQIEELKAKNGSREQISKIELQLGRSRTLLDEQRLCTAALEASGSEASDGVVPSMALLRSLLAELGRERAARRKAELQLAGGTSAGVNSGDTSEGGTSAVAAPPPSHHAQKDRSPPSPAGAKAGVLACKDGVKLRTWLWEPQMQTPVATVTYIHGLGEHGSRFANHLRELATVGVLRVRAFDLRGHGDSQGARGCATFEEIFTDLGALCSSADPRLPHFLFGHSMGGTVALNYALRRAVSPIAGVITTAPLLRWTNPPPTAKKYASRLLSAFTPSTTTEAPIAIKQRTRNISEARRLVEDSKAHTKVSLALLADISKFGEGLLAEGIGPRFRMPIFVAHGGNDEVASLAASREFCSSVGSATLRVFNDARHDLFAEEEGHEVLSAILSFIQAQLGRGREWQGDNDDDDDDLEQRHAEMSLPKPTGRVARVVEVDADAAYPPEPFSSPPRPGVVLLSDVPKFPDAPEGWTCPACTFRNKLSRATCEICNGAIPSTPEAEGSQEPTVDVVGLNGQTLSMRCGAPGGGNTITVAFDMDSDSVQNTVEALAIELSLSRTDTAKMSDAIQAAVSNALQTGRKIGLDTAAPSLPEDSALSEVGAAPVMPAVDSTAPASGVDPAGQESSGGTAASSFEQSNVTGKTERAGSDGDLSLDAKDSALRVVEEDTNEANGGSVRTSKGKGQLETPVNEDAPSKAAKEGPSQEGAGHGFSSDSDDALALRKR